MSVSGVSGAVNNDYTNSYSTSTKKTTEAAVENKPEQTQAETSGVVYEKSNNEGVTQKTTYTPNTALVNKLKADADAQTAQLRDLVQKLISGQGNAIGMASEDDVWSFLASGNYTVSEAAKIQAQQDISEDGYWGVKQTSERILDFAKALTGGDPSKIEDMRKAFKTGFEQATGAWGKELPDISHQTYDAVMKGFDNWAEEANKNAQETQTNPVEAQN